MTEQTARSYIDGLVADLGRSLRGRWKLYLDTRYWIHLRDAAMGRPTHPLHPEILERIRFLVSSGIAISPLSDAAWVELSKQTDQVTLRATAALIEELSQGVALMSEHDRILTEIEQIITAPTVATPVPVLRDRVWVRVGYMLGFLIPVTKALGPEQAWRFQKLAVDHIWQRSIAAIAESTESPSPDQEDWTIGAARLITADVQKYAHEIKSFKQAFTAEMIGTFELVRTEVRAIILQHYRRKGGASASFTEEQAEQATQTGMNILVNGFRFAPELMAGRIPTVYAHAMCHAAMRMDRTRKFKPHDLLDFHHASAGVPYYDAVFTERPLRVLVTAGNVALDKVLRCTILSEEDKILSYLQSLSTRPSG